MDKHFKVLDVFRVWAAVEIVLFHAQLTGLYHANAYLFVDFFFILSGFVLHLTHFESKTFDLTTFVKKRFLRLYPLHLFVLLALILHFALINRTMPKYVDGTVFTLFNYIFMLQGLGFRKISDGDWNFPAWAISAEFWGNIIFALYLRNKNKFTYLLIAIFSYVCIFSFDGHLNTFNYNYFNFLNSGLLRAMAGLCLGAFVASMKKEEASKDTLSWTLAEVGSLSMIIFFLAGPSPVPMKYLDFILIPVLAFFIFVFSFQQGLLSKLLLKSRIDVLAPYTFAAYVVHRLAILLLWDVFSPRPGLQAPIYLLIICVLAFIGKTFIEDPFRKLNASTITLGQWIRAAGLLCLGMGIILLARRLLI